ncbi:hypothetical protein Pmani_004144 [Petrolisthes manimaculis]|uniref:Uncharacterized protein n=1 Tax=Petrolisthes manimaculis TaxID=1843537 RepID=A0AAE1QFA5_9EUCA|nr:hypothetical protein Pmani_004144 [Petrolisthes manimaculis]
MVMVVGEAAGVEGSSHHNTDPGRTYRQDVGRYLDVKNPLNSPTNITTNTSTQYMPSPQSHMLSHPHHTHYDATNHPITHQQGPHRHHTHDDPLKYTPQQHDINPAPATTATHTSGRGVSEEQERVERRWLGSGEDSRNLHKRHLHPNSLAPTSLWYPFNMPWLSSSHRFSGPSHSPHIWHAHQVYLHHNQMMARLHQHMLKMNRRVASIDAHQHQPYNSHSNANSRRSSNSIGGKPTTINSRHSTQSVQTLLCSIEKIN